MTYWLLNALLTTLSLFQTVRAADVAGPTGGGGSRINFPNPLAPCTDFSCVSQKIIVALSEIAIPIVAIMVFVGGFQILTAGGDPEKFKTGRKTILYAVIGFAAIFLARGVVGIIRSILGG